MIRRNGYGDVLTAWPLLVYLKNQNPNANITLVIDERSKGLIPFLKGVDQTYVISKTKFKYWGIFKIIWKLRKIQFDLAFFVRGAPMKLGNIFLFFIRAKKKRAYTDSSWHSKLINDPLPYEKNQYSQAVKSIRLLDPDITHIPKELYPTIEMKKTWTFDRKTLFISITNNRLGCRLDNDKYIRILNALNLEHPFHLIINAEPHDQKKAIELEGKFQMSHQVMITEKFEDLIKLIASIDYLFIGDGGIMHMAAAMQKKQLILFGKTDICEWAPLTDLALCIRDSKNVNGICEDQILEALKKLVS